MPSFEAIIREIVPEAPGTVTLVLDPGERLPYRAGQFISIDPHAIDATRALAVELEARKGKKERPRAYSLASAPHEALLAITVKEEPSGEFPPLLTPYLVHGAKVGDRLSCTGCNGLYVLSDLLPEGAHVVHVTAGSGIVPNYSMLKDTLHRGLPIKQTLINSNKSWQDVIYRDGLAALARRHASSLQVVHALTRDQSAPEGVDVRAGRIDAALLRDLVPSLDDTWFFVCGPSIPQHERRAAKARGEVPTPRFLEDMRALLESIGADRRRISYEGW